MGNRIVKFEGPLNSGKTTLLFKLKSEEFDRETESMASKREKIITHGMTLQYWDIYGREIVRPVYTHSRWVKGYIFVIDSADRENLDNGMDELIRLILLEEKTANAVVMVLANKQDISGAATALEVEDVLKQKYTFSSTSGHTVFVRPCSAKTMGGVNEAFAEFVEQIRLREAGKAKHGLLSLADKKNDVNVKDVERDTRESKEQKESSTKAKAKGFLRNPFCLFTPQC